eukprot:3941405-Rhodomonas_salina.1
MMVLRLRDSTPSWHHALWGFCVSALHVLSLGDLWSSEVQGSGTRYGSQSLVAPYPSTALSTTGDRKGTGAMKAESLSKGRSAL